MRRLSRALAGVLLAGIGCHAASPPRGPEQTCAAACSARASQCGDEACARGCNLVLDRLLENEGAGVVACVSRAAPRCDDRTWAACAARVGPHADGGPPAPPEHPATEDDDQGS